MKKTISWFSAAAVGLSLLIPTISVNAWGPIAATADNTDLTSGGTSTITFNLAENAGFNGVDIQIEYPDSKLSVVDMSTGDLYENAYLKATKNNPGKAGMLIIYTDTIAAGEDVFKITFEAKSGAMGDAVVKISGECTRTDTTTEDFGQAFTMSLPVTGGTVNSSTQKPVATATPAPTQRSSSGGGGGGSSSTTIAEPTNATTAPTATPIVTPKPTTEPTIKPITAPVDFTDLGGHWAADSIKELAAKGYINGFDDNTFRPEENVTRAQFIKMLVEVKGLGTGMTFDVFNDVPEDAWFASYVTAAAADGIVMGDDGNNFNPDLLITRQEMAVMCARAFGFKPSGNVEFADGADIADWAKDSVSALVSENIINGFDEDNTFRPLSNTSRAQAAVVLKRITDK